MNQLIQKIKDWELWCENEDNQNDHIRNFFEDMDKSELFYMLDLVKKQEVECPMKGRMSQCSGECTHTKI
jgi:uncharacterized Zn-finger protein